MSWILRLDKQSTGLRCDIARVFMLILRRGYVSATPLRLDAFELLMVFEVVISAIAACMKIEKKCRQNLPDSSLFFDGCVQIDRRRQRLIARFRQSP